MARIKSNGNLSGAIGNVVFVSTNNQQYVRSKPVKIKQTEKTKQAANIFGLVSKREKLYRTELKNKIPLTSDQYFAARHRARLQRTLVEKLDPEGTVINSFQNPEALIGFNFNQHLE